MILSGPSVGSPVRLLHGDRVTTGRARFVADLDLPGMLHLVVVRSPHARARIVRVETVAAAAAPGVARVVAGDDLVRLVPQIPHRIDPALYGGRHADVRPLAVDAVLYAGQPVAAVLAASREEARAAAAAVHVAYDPLPAVLDAEAALAPDAPRVVEGWPDNVMLSRRIVGGDPAGAFAAAEQVLRATIRIHRYATQPLETRAYVAVYSEFDDLLTLYATTQNPHQLRHQLAGALGRPEHRIRVVAPALGGAFGLKMIGHPEESLVCVLALMTGRPVKWVEDREDCLIIGGREQTHHVEVAVEADGRVTALRDRIVANVGAPYATPGWGMVGLTASTLPCAYAIPHVEIDYTLAVTNKGPWTASRGYGKEASNLIMERVMDLIARRLALDPAEVRRRNLIRAGAFPYTTATGLELDSGDYHAVLERALELGGYEAWRAEQARARAEGRWLGVGLAFELTPEGGSLPRSLVAGYDTSTVRVDPAGTVTVLTGVTNPGGGNDTGIAQIVADVLGLAPEALRVIQGDTDACPYGFGNYSGRGLITGGASAWMAAMDVRSRMARVAALLLDAAPDDLFFAGGRIGLPGAPERSVAFREVAYVAYTRAHEIAGVGDPPLEATCTYRPPAIRHTPDAQGRLNSYPTFSNGAYLAVVEVDPETGRVIIRRLAVVHDCGVIVNPALVDGQLRGAVAMGAGGAIAEVVRYAPDGRRLTTSFREYLMPRAGDLPPIEIAHHVTPSPNTLLGAKGGGEAGVGGAIAAVTNAVADALAPLGAEVLDLPLDPPAVWRLIRAVRTRGTPAS
jgi:carbon-monoxide dehydrogenase large subunit